MSRWAAGVCLVSALILVLLILRAGTASGEEPHGSTPSVGVGAVDTRRPQSVSSSPLATSVASSYGPGLWGRTTACGDTLTPRLRIVAHRWLPCGTRLVICYSLRCTHAVVRDRGPYVGGRTLDLSEAVVRQLGYRSSMHWGVRVVVWRTR